MNFLQILAILFIIWESLMLLYGKKLWNKQIKEFNDFKENKRKINIINFSASLYSLFIIFLLFTQHWIVALFLLIVSVVSAILLAPQLKNQQIYNSKIFTIQLLDSLVSIFLLIQIIKN